MSPKSWHTEPDGRMSALVHNLKLVIRTFDDCARYVILQPATYGRNDLEVLLASGTEPNVSSAIIAASRAAARIRLMLTERLKISTHLDA